MNRIPTTASADATVPLTPAAIIAAGAEACEQALVVDPLDGTAALTLGELALQQGEWERASEIVRRELAERPDNPLAHFILARALQLSGDLTAAEASYRRTIELWPDFAMAHGNLAALLLDTGSYRDALTAGQHAARLDPELADIYLTIGRTFVALLNWRGAEAPLKRGLVVNPDSVGAHNALGHVYFALGRHEEASACHRRAVELEPGNAVAWNGLGSVAHACGKFDEAIIYLSRAIEFDPNLGEAHCALGMCRRAKQDEGELAAMANIFANEALAVSHRVSAAFGLGKWLDDVGRYDEAFSYYRQANEITKSGNQGGEREFKADRLRQKTNKIIEIFTPEFFAEHAGLGHPSDRPIFVTGLYRTGTTLTEQILASHSKVYGAGELQDIGVLRNQLMPRLGRHEKLGQEAIHDMAELYLEKLSSGEKDSLRSVDKHPDNLFSLGLIALLFPKAKIIYCHRDPRDNALSCYFQRFSEYMSFSNDLADCGHHYLETERLAAYWARALPIPILDIQYETLVDDLEGQARRLVDFLDLDWEPRCLNYFDTERAVVTPSAWAVRQPIFTSSAGRWKNYARHLDPLFDVLSDAGLNARQPEVLGHVDLQSRLVANFS